jgi:hypothetical protein
VSFGKYRPKTKVIREACALHIANITPKGRLLGAKPLCVQGCEIWNGNCPIESAIALVHQIEQPQGGNG